MKSKKKSLFFLDTRSNPMELWMMWDAFKAITRDGHALLKRFGPLPPFSKLKEYMLDCKKYSRPSDIGKFAKANLVPKPPLNPAKENFGSKAIPLMFRR
jgi:hypothetical protein